MRKSLAFALTFALASVSLFAQGDQIIGVSGRKVFSGGVAPGQSWTFVQDQSNNATTGSTIVVTLTGAPTSGNAVVCTVGMFPQTSGGSPTGTPTVADSGAHSYTKASNSPSTTNDSTAGSASIYYLAPVPSGATDTITLTVPNAGTIQDGFMVCSEFHPASGTITVDNNAIGNGSGDVLTPTITPSTKALLVSFAAVSGSISAINTPWTSLGPGTFGWHAAYALDQTTATALNFSSSGTYDSAEIAIKAQ